MDDPTPALADCDDPASRVEIALQRLSDALRRCAKAAAAYSDVIWPLVEDLPPGALGHEDEDDDDG